MWTQEDPPYGKDVHLKAAGMMKTAHYWSDTVANWTTPTTPKLPYPVYILGPCDWV